MQNYINNTRHLLSRRTIANAALGATMAVLGACSSSGGGDGGAVSNPSAFNFNAGNAEIAAQIAAAAMSFFPEFTKVNQAIIDIFLNDVPANSPFLNVVPCAAGSTSLAWNDTDVSGDWSVGDTATLQFNNCDLDGGGEAVNGTVTVVATSVNVSLSSFTTVYTVALNLAISLAAETTNLAADFTATVNSADSGINYTNIYTATDAAGQTLTVTENGAEYFAMGCFNVSMSFNNDDLINSTTFSMDPSGPINASNQIMSLTDGAGMSVNNGIVESGIQRLLSIALPECDSIGVPTGVGDSDGSYLDMEAIGGGSIQLTTYDVNDVPTSSVVTTWDQLTN